MTEPGEVLKVKPPTVSYWPDAHHTFAGSQLSRRPSGHTEETRTVENLPISHVISGLSLSLTFGGMTFFSAVMAPLVFTKLPFETAGAFIRQVFPWYYATMGAPTLVALSALLFGASHTTNWEGLLVGLVLLGFVLARQVLMPQINRARDEEMAGVPGADRRFKRLHNTSVVINGVQWVAILAALVLVLV